MENYIFITQHAVVPAHLNMHNNLFGGIILSWLDEAGYLFASTCTGCTNLVTVKMNDVLFKSPAKQGDIIKIYGKLMHTGTTSITVEIKAETCSVTDSKTKTIIECEIIYVRVDKSGRPEPINKQF